MRNVFWALLLANLAYFAWARWIDVPRPPPVNESISRLPRLKLASEEPAALPRGTTATPEKLAFSPPACLSVGPFADEEVSAHAAAQLQPRGFESRQRTEAVEPTIEYGVYLGGMKSDADAERVLKRLEKAGFKDAAIAPDSRGGERRISLGTFTDRARADVRSSAARSRGFKAEVSDRKSSGTAYWLDVTAPTGTTTVPIQDLLAQGLSSRVTVQPCPAPPASTAPTAPKAISVSAPPLAPTPDQAVAAVSKVP
jgi:hypothetical protein